MSPHFGSAFAGEHVDFGDAMGVVFLRHFGDDPAHQFGVGAVAGKVVVHKEIRQRFVRQHGEGLLRFAVADPAVLVEHGKPRFDAIAVEPLLVRRHFVVQRFAVKVVQEQNVFHRKSHGVLLSFTFRNIHS